MSTQSDRLPAERSPRPSPPPTPNFLLRLFHWVGRHVRGFHAAVGTLLGAGVAVIVVCVALFSALADEVMEGDTLAFDRAVLLWMDRHATPWLTGLALNITALGAGTVVFLVVIVASVFLWVSRHRWSAVLLWVSIGGSGLLNVLMKAFFDRERPHVFPWRVPHAGGWSFPSGHSMTAIVCYATLAYLIARLVPSNFLRRFTFAVAALIIVMIGLSRMYLGVHYPTDVLGGFMMGLAWALFCALGISALRHFRHREPEVAAQEQDLDATVDEGPGGDEETQAA